MGSSSGPEPSPAAVTAAAPGTAAPTPAPSLSDPILAIPVERCVSRELFFDTLAGHLVVEAGWLSPADVARFRGVSRSARRMASSVKYWRDTACRTWGVVPAAADAVRALAAASEEDARAQVEDEDLRASRGTTWMRRFAESAYHRRVVDVAPNLESRYNENYRCRVLGVEMSHREGGLIVDFHVAGDMSLGPLQRAEYSRLHVVAAAPPRVVIPGRVLSLDEDTVVSCRGRILFPWRGMRWGASLAFEFGEGGYRPAPLFFLTEELVRKYRLEGVGIVQELKRAGAASSASASAGQVPFAVPGPRLGPFYVRFVQG